MKALYVRRLFLWPRYQAAVKDSLEKNECEVCLLAQDAHSNLRHCLKLLLSVRSIKQAKLPDMDRSTLSKALACTHRQHLHHTIFEIKTGAETWCCAVGGDVAAPQPSHERNIRCHF